MTEGQDPVTRMQQVDLQLWLAGDILLKADKMSMAHSLELRVPYLDKEVFALAAALPAAAKANARMTKIALRQAAARTLPPGDCRPEKAGFPGAGAGLAAAGAVHQPGAGRIQPPGSWGVL